MTARLAAILLLVLGAASPAGATAGHDYRRGEYLVIDGGKAPNGRLAISAGLSGKDGPYLFLTTEPAHKVAGRLDGIAPDDLLDTAPEGFHAVWSSDSLRVAVLFRSDRHVLEMRVYTVDGRNARLVSGPDLLDDAIKGRQFSLDDYNIRARTFQLSWQGPQQFTVIAKWLYDAPDRRLAAALGAYAKESPNTSQTSTDDNGKPVAWTFVDIAINATCQLGPNATYHIVDKTPGRFGWDD